VTKLKADPAAPVRLRIDSTVRLKGVGTINADRAESDEEEKKKRKISKPVVWEKKEVKQGLCREIRK